LLHVVATSIKVTTSSKQLQDMRKTANLTVGLTPWSHR